jgi:hypothetical protein
MQWRHLLIAIIALPLVAGCVLAGYAGYRNYEIRNLVHRLGPGITVRALIPYGPMQCWSEGGGFTGSMRAQLYISDGHARSDYSGFVTRSQSTYAAHTYYTRDGKIYFWREGDERGYITNTNGWISDRSEIDEYTRSSFECQPWWFPDERSIELPDNVSFVTLPHVQKAN